MAIRSTLGANEEPGSAGMPAHLEAATAQSSNFGAVRNLESGTAENKPGPSSSRVRSVQAPAAAAAAPGGGNWGGGGGGGGIGSIPVSMGTMKGYEAAALAGQAYQRQAVPGGSDGGRSGGDGGGKGGGDDDGIVKNVFDWGAKTVITSTLSAGANAAAKAATGRTLGQLALGAGRAALGKVWPGGSSGGGASVAAGEAGAAATAAETAGSLAPIGAGLNPWSIGILPALAGRGGVAEEGSEQKKSLDKLFQERYGNKKKGG